MINISCGMTHNDCKIIKHLPWGWYYPCSHHLTARLLDSLPASSLADLKYFFPSIARMGFSIDDWVWYLSFFIDLNNMLISAIKYASKTSMLFITTTKSSWCHQPSSTQCLPCGDAAAVTVDGFFLDFCALFGLYPYHAYANILYYMDLFSTIQILS